MVQTKEDGRRPISGPLLCEKAMQLSESLGQQGEGKKVFKASDGWKWRFCKRHGIQELSLQGEKLSADREAVSTFVPTFKSLIADKHLSLNQIFNCDESGLNFRLLPEEYYMYSDTYAHYAANIAIIRCPTGVPKCMENTAAQI